MNQPQQIAVKEASLASQLFIKICINLMLEKNNIVLPTFAAKGNKQKEVES